MSISNKVKMVLSYRDKSISDTAKIFDCSSQSLSNKFSRGTFTSSDLIKIADFCDCQLSFTFKDGSKIVLDMSDLSEK